jgi:hypothetical protein
MWLHLLYQPQNKADKSPSSAKVYNEWNFNYMLPICCHGMVVRPGQFLLFHTNS